MQVISLHFWKLLVNGEASKSSHSIPGTGNKPGFNWNKKGEKYMRGEKNLSMLDATCPCSIREVVLEISVALMNVMFIFCSDAIYFTQREEISAFWGKEGITIY